MQLDTLQLNHTHSFLISHICVEWIDANAGALAAHQKFRLLDIMLPFANYELAMREDELPTWQTIHVGFSEPIDFVTCELGFKHEQN